MINQGQTTVKPNRLAIILGDQLSANLSCLQALDPGKDTILMCEVWHEISHIKHHPKKIVLIISAMRHFRDWLVSQGYHVEYVSLDDADNTQSFEGEWHRAIDKHCPTQLVMTQASEFRVHHLFQACSQQTSIPFTILPDSRFYASTEAFAEWATQRKQLTMEWFYRDLRRRHNVLMVDDKPVGGVWNTDQQNRKVPPKSFNPPPPLFFDPDPITQVVIDTLSGRLGDHFGDLHPFRFAVTAAQAQQALAYFVTHHLPTFGDYQDAMRDQQPWLSHAHIGMYLNIGLLTARTCVQAAMAAFDQGLAPLNCVEGFIRQILGWREYVRGLYWYRMPEYAELNYFAAIRPLPDFFWGADTNMRCLSKCIDQTKTLAYAHHIQRLMVIGNFALLAGLDPQAVNQWYLCVYADAFEWVELPNVTGMALFADGGVLATKPYAASGSYINKMSDYCKNCTYKVKEKLGKDACPFNYLYWYFLIKHQPLLQDNHRMAMPYRTLAKFSQSHRDEIVKSAEQFLGSL